VSKIQYPFLYLDDYYFGIVTCDNNTNPVAEKPMKIEMDEVKSSLPMNFNHLPIRYGSAADIPYDEGFNLKSILNSKPIIPSNNIMTLLNDNKFPKHPPLNNNFNELLTNHIRDRENLLQIAKQTQQDFINAINLD
jgi:hypothetical protein